MEVYQHWDFLLWFLIQICGVSKAANDIVDKTVNFVGVEGAKNLKLSLALPL